MEFDTSYEIELNARDRCWVVIGGKYNDLSEAIAKKEQLENRFCEMKIRVVMITREPIDIKLIPGIE